MIKCPSCNADWSPTSKFCGNCGTPLSAQQTQSENKTPQKPISQTVDSPPESFGPGADAIIAFVNGKTFYWIMFVFGLVGVGYGLMTGTLSSGSVPGVGETVRPQIPNRNMRSPWRDSHTQPRSHQVNRGNSAQNRHRAAEQQRRGQW